ncbi:MAG: hypothetical protein K2X32_12170 [Phycisphaerales bacterium]|nr:hypothetical protein [Phycisphaerales bacterium]
MTQPSTTGGAKTAIVVAIDVTNLGTSEAFYGRLLGFERVNVVRQGLIFEERHLSSPRVPGFLLMLREAFGKRPIGTQPGSVLRIGFAVEGLAEAIRSSDPGVRWQNGRPADASALTHARLIDPDGYIVELFEGTPGVGF